MNDIATKTILMLLSAVYFVESQEKFIIWKWPINVDSELIPFVT